MRRITLLALLAGASIASAAISEPVKIDSGLITATTTTSDEVRVFKGIPCAAPPVGTSGVARIQHGKSGSAIVFGDAVSAGTQIEPQMLSFYGGFCERLTARQ